MGEKFANVCEIYIDTKFERLKFPLPGNFFSNREVEKLTLTSDHAPVWIELRAEKAKKARR